MRAQTPRTISKIPTIMRGRIGRLLVVKVMEPGHRHPDGGYEMQTLRPSGGVDGGARPGNFGGGEGAGSAGASRLNGHRGRLRAAARRVGRPPQPADALADLV